VFYPLLPEIRTEFGFSLGQGGFLATGFTLGLAAAGIAGGFLADRMARKPILIYSLVIFSIGTLLVPLSMGFVDMALYRIVSGIGEGLQSAAIYAVAGSFFFHRRGLAFGILSAAFGIGVFVGPLIGHGLSAAWGDWRAAFFVFGAAGLLIAVAMTVGLRREITEAHHGGGGAVVDVSHVAESPYNRNTLMFGIASACGGLIFYGFLGLYPTYLREVLKFTPGETALAAGLIGAGAATGIFFGWLGDSADQRKLLIGTFLSISVASWFTYQGPTTPGWQYLLAFLMGTFAAGALHVNCNSAMTRAVRPHQIGRGEGLFLGSYYTAAAVSGLLFAMLVGSLGWGGAALWQFTLLPLVAVAALWFVDSSKQITTGRH